MYKINKAFADPIDLKSIEAEIQKLKKFLIDIMEPSQILLFGSAVNGPFYEDSDFDFLLVFKCEKNARNAWRLFQKVRRKSTRSIDLIAMSEEEFNAKKSIGGIAMLAYSEGRILH